MGAEAMFSASFDGAINERTVVTTYPDHCSEWCQSNVGKRAVFALPHRCPCALRLLQRHNALIKGKHEASTHSRLEIDRVSHKQRLS